MGKVDINKKQKKNALLQTAFDLFRDKGFAKTTISDIVSDAGLAKGTFYLYFKDKYDLRDKLIAHKAGQLFADAHHALLDQKFNSFEDQIIAVADYIIGRLNDDHGLLTFISKNLSWGIFKTAFENTLPDESLQFYDYIFEQMKEVTPLALQKILYFIQGIYMVIFGKPLYKEDCMAWIHGPVYEEVYDLFRDFKYNPIEDNRFAIFKDRFEELSEQEKKIIDLVINTFGKYSGKVLEDITHEELPWKNARVGYEPSEPSREIISKDEIKNYFIHVADTYGVDTEEKLNRYIQSYML